MRKDVVYLGMIRWNDSISLNTSDEGYNNGKKYGQKCAICGPNIYMILSLHLSQTKCWTTWEDNKYILL
jgi:hypothetical protein